VDHARGWTTAPIHRRRLTRKGVVVP
jgi:hypothetical protein